MDSFIQFLTAMTIRRCAAWLLLAPLSGCAVHFTEHPPIVDLRNVRDADAIDQIRALGRNGDWLIIRGYHLSDLVRPVWSDERTSGAAVSKAREVVGKPYDLLGLIGFNVPEQYYCSELNLEIYRRREDLIPRPIEPVRLIYWGRVLFDSGAL